VTAQIAITRIATMNAHFEPSYPEAVVANFPKASPLDSMAIWEDSWSSLSFDRSFEEPRCDVFMCVLWRWWGRIRPHPHWVSSLASLRRLPVSKSRSASYPRSFLRPVFRPKEQLHPSVRATSRTREPIRSQPSRSVRLAVMQR
jgi:hypothetical protein